MPTLCRGRIFWDWKLVGRDIGFLFWHLLTIQCYLQKLTSNLCDIIKDILDKYCLMYGQLVNFHKSSFQCTKNISEEMVANFSSIIQMSSSFSLGNYLGCPIIYSRVPKNTFQKVVQSINSQLPKWKANSLSQVGRSVLIHANLATKANFQMQSFLLPASIHGESDKSYRNFFWNKSLEAGSSNLIGWIEFVCLKSTVCWDIIRLVLMI